MVEACERINEEKMRKGLALDQELNRGAGRFQTRRPPHQKERRSTLNQEKLN